MPANSEPNAPVVDAHAHIFHRGMPLIDQPRHRPAYDFTLQDYLAQLDAHGVQFGVIAAASPWGDHNEYTLESVESEPRLRGTVILHPGKRYDLAAMKRRGIVGVRLPFIGLPEIPDLAAPDYRQLLKQIADQGWHIHLHVEGKHIPALLPALERCGARIVIDHLGRPGPDEGVDCPAFRAIARSVEQGHSWIKASCAYRIGPGADAHFQAFLQELGPDRLFWASDCPFVGHEQEVNYADTLAWLYRQGLDAEALRKVLGANAHAFYFQE